MPDRVDAAKHNMQVAVRKPMVDCIFAPPPLQQLPSSHHPMLPLRQLSQASVPRPASPSQPAYIAG